MDGEGACLRLVLSLPSLYDGTGFIYRGLSPHKFTLIPGVHKGLKTDLVKRISVFLNPLSPAVGLNERMRQVVTIG